MKGSAPPVCGFSPPADDAVGAADDDAVGAAPWVQAASRSARTTARAMLLPGNTTTPLVCQRPIGAPGMGRWRGNTIAYEREGKQVQWPRRGAAGSPLGRRS